MRIFFNVSIPGEATFLKPLNELAFRMAGYAGYSQAEARQIASAVVDAAARAIKDSGERFGPIDIRFQQNAEQFEVMLTYGGHPKAQPDTAACLHEGWVCSREGEVNVCRMARQLPAEPS